MIREYGPKDEDTTAYDKLEAYCQLNDITPLYIAHHKRRPTNSKQCQWPGSVRVQAVLATGKVITSLQLKPGGPATIERN